MKSGVIKSFFYLGLIVYFYHLCAHDPLLVVAIMVKDEESVIKATLAPYVEYDKNKEIGFLVFDTGPEKISLTMQKAQELFNEYGISKAYIFQEPFVDFSTSRNRALDLVEMTFPNACFVLMIDAEWYINDVHALLEFCKKEADANNFGPYFIRLIESRLDFYTPRLLRQTLHSRFKGVVHEALVVYASQVAYTRLSEAIFFRYSPSNRGQEKSKARYIRDCQLLLQEFQKDPTNTHTTFYLAQTYEFLGDWQNAYYYYDLRCNQPGWEEDNFLAAYRRAVAAENLYKQGTTLTWPHVHELYLQAYAMRPTRIEPLIKIAHHYLDQNSMALSFLYAKYALDIPYPASDTSFVEKSMYDFERYTLMGVAAWYVGSYDLGKWAIKKALEVQPDNQLLHNNLQFYLNHTL